MRRLPARQAEAENERDCCGAANDARDVGVVLRVVGVIKVEVCGVVVVVVLRRERMAEENGRLD